MKYSHISVAVPMLAEHGNLPRLMDALCGQTILDFTVYCCVNNREGWSDDGNDGHRSSYLDNQTSLDYLRNFQRLHPELLLVILDHSSIGKGWQGKQHGVGWARKVMFDAIANNSGDNEVIVSLDADTDFSSTYLESVLKTFNNHPEHSAICLPYYHPLSGNDTDDRAMLRYEIYMRHYLINLLESGNPYAFTALGSAMAFPLWAYKRVGGITPLQGGEDFYLMQKFAKTGRLLLSCNESVKPQGRPSSRVPFGTGPAIAKGVDAMDDTYPIYPAEGFKAIADTYALFPRLYDEDVETPMSDFLRQQLKTIDLWEPMRKNFKTRELFVHACSERVDGLRILQYLKAFPLRRAEEELQHFCNSHSISIPDNFSFRESSIVEINSVRNAFFELECSLRKRFTS